MRKINIKLIVFLFVLVVIFVIFLVYKSEKDNQSNTEIQEGEPASTSVEEILDSKEENKVEVEENADHPMNIEVLNQKEFPGGDFVVEEELPNGSNYSQSIVSYQSEGLKIRGLLTVPLSPAPENGFSGIVFVHGYIPPKEYSTTGSYPTYQATLARSGMVTFKPDLRGHDESEGQPVSAHYSEKYLLDTLSAIAYLKNHPEVNPDKIGYWGHSNGGETGLRAMILDESVKAGVFWAGVVGSYEDMLETYNDKIPFLENEENPLINQYGLPSENPDFWRKIKPYNFLNKITAPIQLHHGTNDESVPIELSVSLKEALEKEGKSVEYFEYSGDDHNISANSGLAWRRTIRFFEENL